jgi:hypothetical protein
VLAASLPQVQPAPQTSSVNQESIVDLADRVAGTVFVDECHANLKNGWHGIHKNSDVTPLFVPATRPGLEWACHAACGLMDHS